MGMVGPDRAGTCLTVNPAWSNVDHRRGGRQGAGAAAEPGSIETQIKAVRRVFQFGTGRGAPEQSPPNVGLKSPRGADILTRLSSSRQTRVAPANFPGD